MGETLNSLGSLRSYDWIVINSSSGKDSQTALREVVRMADAEDYPRDHIIVSHQCLGDMEWSGTRELAKEQADHYGLEFIVTKYRNRDGEELSLLDYVEKRGKWMGGGARFCTSEFKRSPGGRVLTMLRKRSGSAVRILYVFGFRADESDAREKKPVFELNKRQSSSVKEVYNYLPIHEWHDDEVWADIEESGVPHHYAYDLGMPRLSCVFCIFAPKAALVISGKANPELLDRYVALEEKIDHKFTEKISMKDIKEAIDNNEAVEGLDGNWNM